MEGIEEINARWDDDPNHWRGNSYIRLDEVPVPMFYWREIYANRFPAIWSTIKSQWNKYKMVVEYYRRSSPEAFRARFSVNGTLLGLNDITSRIRAERAEEDHTLASHARKALGDELQVLTTYRKGSNRVTMQSDRAIARKLRESGTVLPPPSPPPSVPLPAVPGNS
ncbi:hypothetical protein L210DRAFT_3421456 [Boletus edulis BED1]|uniref:Uncharacterized protein n=1 Tax=Boletus edulis BED1 TaxID=1328754 RepID=A0AAD4BEK4_BOLED|nr:hypothetical protein L210DRAFT_3423014 [Boletus edulis BED1]KAF8425070.1 hypothetical protein L210DRAFT_3421456 [Boletus edulis BED1]